MISFPPRIYDAVELSDRRSAIPNGLHQGRDQISPRRAASIFAASIFPIVIVAERTPSRTTAGWMDRCAAARLPAMAVRDLADMLDDPHLRKTRFFTRRTHPTEGDFWEMAAPVSFGAVALPAPAPRIGEDAEAVKRQLG